MTIHESELQSKTDTVFSSHAQPNPHIIKKKRRESSLECLASVETGLNNLCL